MFVSYIYQTKPIGVLQISPSMSVNYVDLMEKNSTLGSFPTPMKLQISIFTSVVELQIWPVHNLELAIKNKNCQLCPPNCKTLSCADRDRSNGKYFSFTAAKTLSPVSPAGNRVVPK